MANFQTNSDDFVKLVTHREKNGSEVILNNPKKHQKDISDTGKRSSKESLMTRSNNPSAIATMTRVS